MTLLRTRESDFDLCAAAAAPHFTPRRDDLPGLLALLGQPSGSKDPSDPPQVAERALLRMGLAIVPDLCAAAAEARSPLRKRLCQVLGRFYVLPGAGGVTLLQAEALRARARGFLLAALGDEDPQAQRAAAVALGHGPRASAAEARESGSAGGAPSIDSAKPCGASSIDEEVELALLAAWESAPTDTQGMALRRALAAALGKVGGERAQAALGQVEPELLKDAELARIVGKAAVMLTRTLQREGPSVVAIDRVLPGPPTPLWLRCRAGLEGLIVDRLRALPGTDPRVLGSGRVQALLTPALGDDGLRRIVQGLRLWMGLGFPLPPLPLPAEGDEGERQQALAARIVEALDGPVARALLSSYTRGQVRLRLDFPGGGHRRSLVWRCAELLRQTCPHLHNDPTDSAWTVEVEERGGRLQLSLWPRSLLDARFDYRRGAVPASSHPTLAAALVEVAGVRPDDVVWDPFVGSGLELCERVVAGPFASLYGGDVLDEALDKARDNLAALGVTEGPRLTLRRGDARETGPERPTLILTNPPMGRRVARDGELQALLLGFLEQAARRLARGGRLVWISPLPALTARALRQAGLAQAFLQDVDLGGFSGQIQAFVRER